MANARGCQTDALRPAAFTLIELRVVIAIVASFAAMLFPALSKGKARALSVSCMNNLKQLQVCWHLYAVDHSCLRIIRSPILTQGMCWQARLPDVPIRRLTTPIRRAFRMVFYSPTTRPWVSTIARPIARQ